MKWIITIEGFKAEGTTIHKIHGEIVTFPTEELANQEIDWMDENPGWADADSCKAVPQVEL